MAEAHGNGGSITLSGAQTGVKMWRISLVGDTHDITDFADGTWRTHLAGLKGWSGSFDANWDPGNTAQVGTSIHATFTAAASDTYVGTIILQTHEVTVDVENVNQSTFTFVGQAQPTITL